MYPRTRLKTKYMFSLISQCQLPRPHRGGGVAHSVQSIRKAGDTCVITSDAYLDRVLGGVSQDSLGK